MSTKTSNRYGKITISKRAIKDVACFALRECYGVQDGVISDILTEDNKIYLTVKLFLRFGVGPEAVTASVRDAVKYAVEQFTGMKLVVLNLNVAGIK